MWKGRRAKAVVPGGLSTGVMTEAEFDTPLDFSAPMRVGCLGLGTACVVVFDETYSMVDFLHNSCRFFAHESCGQCTPCREGTHWALQMLERIKAGRGRLRDLDLLLEIGDSIGIIPGTTICGLADGAAWPIKNAIRKFRGEFEDYIKRTNPQGYMETEPVPAWLVAMARSPSGRMPATNHCHLSCQPSSSTTAKSRFPAGGGINGIEAAKLAGIEIPHYCWHPGLSVVGSCRMCLVEVGSRDPKTGKITMQPKLVPACNTWMTDNMVLVTNSEKVARARAMVEEGLLLRHPDRLSDLRQGRRVRLAGLSLPVRSRRAPGRSPPVHQPAARHRRRDAVRRSLRPVQPVRALHGGNQRHQRADVHRPRRARGNRRRARLSPEQQALGQRGRSLPGRGAGRQGFLVSAAGLVHAPAPRRLHRLRHRLLDLDRGEPGPHLPDQAARKPVCQQVVDLQRRPLRLSARPQPAAGSRSLAAATASPETGRKVDWTGLPASCTSGCARPGGWPAWSRRI